MVSAAPMRAAVFGSWVSRGSLAGCVGGLALVARWPVGRALPGGDLYILITVRGGCLPPSTFELGDAGLSGGLAGVAGPWCLPGVQPPWVALRLRRLLLTNYYIYTYATCVSIHVCTCLEAAADGHESGTACANLHTSAGTWAHTFAHTQTILYCKAVFFVTIVAVIYTPSIPFDLDCRCFVLPCLSRLVCPVSSDPSS